MATVNKDFKIKSGLIVEGTTATVNNYDILTKKQADQDYIVSLIGGTATSANTPDTVVKRDGNGDFAAQNVTVNTLYVGGSTNNGIDVVDGNTEIGSNSGILLSATDDILLNTYSSIVLHPSDFGDVYIKNKNGESRVATRGYVDQEVSDAKTEGNEYANSVVAEEVIERNYAIGSAIDSAISDEVANRNSAISTAKSEAIYDASVYTNNHVISAINTAAVDATIKTDGAKSYADGLISTEITDRNTAIATAKGEAINSAEGYTDSAITALDLANTYDAKGVAAQALADANTYTDGEIAGLVDSAPDLLNTLNEIAQAIAANPNYATDVATAISSRVAKSGDTMTGDLVLPGAPTLNLHAATKGYVDGEINTLDTAAQGYADTAETASNGYTDSAISTEVTNRNSAIATAKGQAIFSANSYADGLAVNYDAYGAASTAQGNAEDYADGLISTEVTNRNSAITTAIGTEVTNRNTAITTAIDALSTTGIEEGSNLYFTDGRAKTSAADLLTGATLSNITITGTGAGLTITAENGVADSDTDDLDEGITNLYFTAQRAVNALEAVVPNFTAVEVNSVAKQVAATVSCPVAGINQAYGFDSEAYRSAEFLVKVAYGSHTEISKVLLTLDSSDNIAITEYGIVGTNGSASSISADISGGNVRLLATTVNNNSTVTVMGTLLV